MRFRGLSWGGRGWLWRTVGIVFVLAVQTSLLAGDCAAPPQGLVSWWRAEGSANDTIGTNNGTGTVPFVAGMVGQSFSFNGANQFIQVPSSLSLNPANALTLEAWVNISAPPSLDVVSIATKESTYGTAQYQLGLLNTGGGLSFRGVLGLSGGYAIANGNTTVQTATWYHLAVTYDGSAVKLYLNGTLDSSSAASGNIATGTDPLYIGCERGGWFFNGKVDELSLYSRALSAPEIQAIYNAGAAGKCFTPVPPVIFTQPQSQTVYVGENVLLSVAAGGAQPLLYQWQKDGSDLNASTDSALGLTNVQIGNAGDYWVIVSNAAGSITSSTARLTVNLRPPTIVLQPASQMVYVGDNTSFSAAASGTPPLFYQWQKDGSDLGGATATGLTLTNVQAIDAGGYWVIVSNAAGSITSSVATLTVSPEPSCTPPSPSMTAWWQAEGDAGDSLSGSLGVVMNGAGFAPGKVGQAFTFNGVNQYIQVPDSPGLDPSAALTMEAWVNISAAPSLDVVSIATKESTYGTAQYQLGLLNTGGRLSFRGVLGLPGGYSIANGNTTVQTNTWYHLAVTYDGSAVKLYVNGALDGSSAGSGNIATGTAPLYIGCERGGWFFNGKVDELSVYSAALSLAEVQAIYHAMMAGKCSISTAPFVFTQPANQSVTLGQNATFSVGVSGGRPLRYQWRFNGSEIPDSTNAALTLTNVQMSQAGSYAVAVTNTAGWAISSNAVLTVVLPPATVRVVNTAAEGGREVAVPVILVANGNENAVGFSLNFSTNRLAFNGVNLGAASTGAALLVNTNSITTGKLGIALSLPTGNIFAAGTQELVEVSFTAAVLTTPATTTINFGDLPTQRELSDAQANLLLANYTGGTVSIARAMFEGDVSPRPNGDGAATITDWVLVGRYAAVLDSPTNSSEFQRADCAPRSTLGDGAITVADWVQAGRYAAGLDPLTLAGGPTAASKVTFSKGNQKDLSRVIRVGDTTLLQNQTGPVSVYLEAQGDENAVGGSLSFDPATFTYLSATLGSGATGATLNFNAAQAGSGRLAFVLALPIGNHFAAVTNELVKISFRTAATAVGTYAISLTDQPVVRQVVDPTATPLACNYVNGNIMINPPPSLRIQGSGPNVTMAWPLWATNFVLQESAALQLGASGWTNVAVTAGVTNGEQTVTLPQSTMKFYRLRQAP